MLAGTLQEFSWPCVVLPNLTVEQLLNGAVRFGSRSPTCEIQSHPTRFGGVGANGDFNSVFSSGGLPGGQNPEAGRGLVGGRGPLSSALRSARRGAE